MAYDSRTDHLTYGELFRGNCVEGAEHHYVNAAPRKVKRFAKRARSKANRRMEFPQTQMRGYGWGQHNYKVWD